MPKPTSRQSDPVSSAQLRDALTEQREFRIEQLTHLHQLDTRAPLAGGDPEVFRSLDEGARAALRDVQAALWRMDDGTYGRCITCGAPVEPARLEIVPQTANCLDCARPA